MGLMPSCTPDFFVCLKDTSNIVVFRAFSYVILAIGTIVIYVPCEFIQL